MQKATVCNNCVIEFHEQTNKQQTNKQKKTITQLSCLQDRELS